MKGELVNKRTGGPVLSDGRMSLRQWARTRRVPISTAHRAAQSGRITRDADGKLDPVRADREWYENTRPRVDMRHLAAPTSGGDDGETWAELRPMAPEELEQRYGVPSPDPEDTVRVVDAMTVEAALEDLLARELVASVNLAIRDIAPKLARPQDAGWIAERLHNALIDGWMSAESEWRRRFPREHAGTHPAP